MEIDLGDRFPDKGARPGPTTGLSLSAGQTSDDIGARALLPSIPNAAVRLGDRGYETGWFRNALIDILHDAPPERTLVKVTQPM